jgi:hypothetical protein
MTYKVSISSGYNYSAKLSRPLNYKTSLSYDIEIMPQTLDELTDVEISGNNDKYVLMYDSASGKWRDRNPDEVLSAASNTETTQPGLPNDFINTLDVDLDNKIDLDAGTF